MTHFTLNMMTQSNLSIKGVYSISVFLIASASVLLHAFLHSEMEKVNAKRKEVGHVTTLHLQMGERPALALGRRLLSVRLQVRGELIS